ncbi:MAG: ERCC4 domain-containing protein, partial [Candidatus Hodarchaeales archaeon]
MSKLKPSKIFFESNLSQLKAYAKKRVRNKEVQRKDIPYYKDASLLSILALIGYDFVDMDLKVDNREHSEMIAKAVSAGYEIEQLETGDYTSKFAGVERKSEDFLDSLFSRRIFQQLRELDDKKPFVFLAIDKNLRGIIEEAKRRNIHESVVWGAIASLCVRGYVPLFLGNKHYCQRLISKIHEKSFDGKDRVLEYSPIRINRPTSDDWKLHIISQFPGIGEERAKKLLDAFDWDLQEVLEYSWWFDMIDDDSKKWMGL